MRPRLFLLLVFLSFLIPRPVQAQTVDYVSLAIEALQSSNVYVAPGTPGTDYNTPSQLSVYLQPNDNIVLVMLPPEALSDTDILTVAKKIFEGLNNQKIIGLAVGDKLIGYSTQLPSDVVVDLMANARSVSNSPVTALFTFSRNVQLWLIRNPQPKPTATPEPTPTPRPTMAPIELPKTDEVPLPIWGVFVIGFFVMVATMAVQIKKARDKNKYNSLISKIKEDN